MILSFISILCIRSKPRIRNHLEPCLSSVGVHPLQTKVVKRFHKLLQEAVMCFDELRKEIRRRTFGSEVRIGANQGFKQRGNMFLRASALIDKK